MKKKRKRNIRHRFLQIPVGEFAQTNSFISHAFATTSDSTQPITKQNKKEKKRTKKEKKKKDLLFLPSLPPPLHMWINERGASAACVLEGVMGAWMDGFSPTQYVCMCVYVVRYVLSLEKAKMGFEQSMQTRLVSLSEV